MRQSNVLKPPGWQLHEDVAVSPRPVAKTRQVSTIMNDKQIFENFFLTPVFT